MVLRLREVAIALAVAALYAALGMRSFRHAPDASSSAAPQSAAPPARILRVSRATSPMDPNGETDEPAWRDAARTGGFLDARGAEARPRSEAALNWTDEALCMALYAADEDVRVAGARPDAPPWPGDRFRVVLGGGAEARLFELSPGGVMADARRGEGGAWDYGWTSGARAGVDVDGTPDDPRDDDEEWVVETCVPLRALGVEPREGERFAIDLERCDTTHDGARRCGSWQGDLELVR